MFDIAVVTLSFAGLNVLDALLLRFPCAIRITVIDVSRAGGNGVNLESEVAGQQFAALSEFPEISIRYARTVGAARSADLTIIALGEKNPSDLNSQTSDRPSGDAVSVHHDCDPAEILKAKIIRQTVRSLEKNSYDGLALILDNPVDLLTTVAQTAADEATDDNGSFVNRIFGIGTAVSTDQFRSILADRLNVSKDDVGAFVIGERGRIEIPCWSSATVAQTPLHHYCPNGKRPLNVRDRVTIFERIRAAVLKRDAHGGTSQWVDALICARIVQAIANGENRVFTVSVPQSHFESDADCDDRGPCCYSRPTVIGRSGILRIVEEFPMNENEQLALAECARSVRARYRKVIQQCDA